jgi:hypothetical protein
MDKADTYVLVSGVVHLHTSLGMFLDVGERRVFLPELYCGDASLRRFAPGEVVTLQVVRSFAEEEKLIA